LTFTFSQFLCLESSEKDVLKLDPIIITATRIEGDVLEQPYAIYQTESEELEKNLGRTNLDRMDGQPGVLLQRTAPNQASPFIRGLTGEQTLIMLDGVRLSHAAMRPGPNQYSAMVPDTGISTIETILGSASVLGGSQGLTGALNFRNAEAGRGIDDGFSPWLDTRLDWAHGYNQMVGVDGVSENWRYSIEGSYRHEGDRRGGKDASDRLFGAAAGSRDIPNTGYEDASFSWRVAYDGLRDHALAASFGHNRQEEAPRPDGFYENSGKSGRISRVYDPQTFTYFHLKDQWYANNTWMDVLETTLSWHQHDESQNREDIRNSGGVTTDDVYRRRELADRLGKVGIDLVAKLRLDERHNLSYGLSYSFEKTDNQYREYRTSAGIIDPNQAVAHNTGNWSNETTISDGAEYQTQALFVMDEIRLDDRWKLRAGLRYSSYKWSFGQVDGDTSDLTWSLRNLYHFKENQKWFVGVSKAFRAPNLTNLDGSVDRGSNGQLATGNPNLSPEASITYETGWQWIGTKHDISTSAFLTELDDLIQNTGTTFANLNRGRLHGFEALWKWNLFNNNSWKLSLNQNATFVRGRVDLPSGIRDNISRANRFFGKSVLDLSWDSSWIRFQCRWHDAYDKVAASDSGDVRLTVPGDTTGAMPGYAVFDLQYGMQFKHDKNWSWNVFAENLLDKTYRIPGSGTDGAGLNLGLRLQKRFL
jgi:outer membrane receptor protein involved in Fe transport